MAVQDEARKGTQAPYIPYRTFKAFFERFDPVPLRIDRSLLRYTSGGNQTMLLQAFRSLGLMSEDGTPTEEMSELGKALTQGGKEPLKKLLMKRYPGVFKLDLNRATGSQLIERLEEMGLSGDTARKAAAFFLAAVEDAGIEYSKHLKPKSTPTGLRGRPARAKKAKRDEPDSADDRTPPALPGQTTLRSDLPPALSGALPGIIGLLPSNGADWTKAQRDTFMSVLGGFLDLCYPGGAEKATK